MKSFARFYDAGLRFNCKQCGQCCQRPAGSVKISEKEIMAVTSYLKMNRSDFLQNYILPDSAGWKLKEREDGACIFLEEGRCAIYPFRPLQCFTFPFWPENVKSSYRWKQLQDFCPGIGKGKYTNPAEIEQLLRMQSIQDNIQRHWGPEIQD